MDPSRPSLPPWLDLSGASAVITGGGTHLGLAMATALGDLGAAVHLVGRREQVVSEAAASLRDADIEAHVHAADAADPAAVEAVLDRIDERHGRLDVMVCNAGGSRGGDQVPDIDADDLAETLRMNVGTSMVCAQAAARRMMPAGRGAIILVGSIHGHLGSDPGRYAPGFRRSPASYHASKGAIVNLTRALATEVGGHGITVNCISPGQIPKARMDDDTRARQREGVPLGRLGVPEDLRGAVALFAAPAGSWITGQDLVVDGGWSAW